MILYVQVEVLSAVVDSIANSVGANAIIDVGSGQVVLLSLIGDQVFHNICSVSTSFVWFTFIPFHLYPNC